MKINEQQKEKEIQGFIKNLGLTREEAEQLWLDDNSDIDTPEQIALTKKAQTLGRHMGESIKERKPRNAERKVDVEKGEILTALNATLTALGVTNVSIKTETEIHFKLNENSYTLKLTKHREKK